MIRLTSAIFYAFLLTGCGGNRTPLPLSAPVTATALAAAAPEAGQTAELTILGVTPGKTTLEEFKTRFKVTEVKGTGAPGVVTAQAGPGAVLQGDGVRLHSLVAASIDGMVFDVKLQTIEDQSAILEKMWGKPTPGENEAQTWVSDDLKLIYFPKFKTLRILNSSKGLEAYARGYKTP